MLVACWRTPTFLLVSSRLVLSQAGTVVLLIWLSGGDGIRVLERGPWIGFSTLGFGSTQPGTDVNLEIYTPPAKKHTRFISLSWEAATPSPPDSRALQLEDT